MAVSPIANTPRAKAPRMPDYARARRAFSWADAGSMLAGLPGGRGINIADEAVDRHLREGHGQRVALRWLARDGRVLLYRYAELAMLSNRFANALATLGVQPGERVFTLLGRVPALYIAALGSWKHHAVVCPLFAAFGPEPIAARMTIARPSVLVTTPQLFQRKLAPLLDRLPFLRQVILVQLPDTSTIATPTIELGHVIPACHCHDFDQLLEQASPDYTIPATAPKPLATLHFTSGTTGRPKARGRRVRSRFVASRRIQRCDPP